jgi:hypothetical protein
MVMGFFMEGEAFDHSRSVISGLGVNLAGAQASDQGGIPNLF